MLSNCPQTVAFQNGEPEPFFRVNVVTHKNPLQREHSTTIIFAPRKDTFVDLDRRTRSAENHWIDY